MPCISMGSETPVLPVNTLSIKLDGITPFISPMLSESLERIEKGKAILPHHLRIGVATSLALRQARILDPLAVALIPREGRHCLQPGGSDGRQFVERSPEGLRYQFEAIHHTDSREHMRRVGALLAPCFDESHCPTL